jgi:23S rRNA A1618 N6-methylase RlmF
LCPPLANRLNYLHWVEDLLALGTNPRQSVRGIDIGTGASCIYPLLGTSLHKNWSFLATEIDQASAASANANVERNLGLQDRIHVLLVSGPTAATVLGVNILNEAASFRKCTSTSGMVAHSDEQEQDTQEQEYDFCMCNPPFFASEDEQQHLSHPGHSCAGSISRYVTVRMILLLLLRLMLLLLLLLLLRLRLLPPPPPLLLLLPLANVCCIRSRTAVLRPSPQGAKCASSTQSYKAASSSGSECAGMWA